MTAFHLGTRRFVVVLDRPGGQSLFSATLTTQTEATDPIERVQLYILANPCADLSLAGLAAVGGLSPRHLSRLFRAVLETSPAAYVEATRIDRARRLLEDGGSPIKTIAYRAGFGSTATLRRAFQRRLGISPLEYRRRRARADREKGDAC